MSARTRTLTDAQSALLERVRATAADRDGDPEPVYGSERATARALERRGLVEVWEGEDRYGDACLWISPAIEV